MNIELRWVERETMWVGIRAPHSTTERVLQYRVPIKRISRSEQGLTATEELSDWRDIPVEAE